MRTMNVGNLGVDQGDVEIFSDFQTGGAMWTGGGSRERRKKVTFSEPFRARPVVHVTLSLLDADTGPFIRTELTAENITRYGCDLVFKTWADSKVARVRAAWLAIGEVAGADDWDV